jgi:mannose-1-phosphate guanylyltransferase / mannose-6-phosphate isomerase
MLIYPVLLCGGSGTRLWPLSRKSYPKQFSSLTGDQSLFQGTALRLSGAGFDLPVIVTGSDFRFIVTEQLDAVGIKPKSILIEPMAKNTAPAILAATLLLSDTDPDGLMLVAPSDHVIPDMERFRQAVMAAVPAAQEGRIVTFGIRPDRAETGFGWLELSDPPGQDFAPVPQPLVRFVEKPDATVAAEMLAGGRHLWNAGIFLFSARTLIDAFARHDPETLDLVRKAHDGARRDLSFVRLAQQPWSALQDVSIDYSIMEKSDNLTVMPYGGVWSDLGGWEAVWRESGPDANGVVLRGPATAIDCADSLIRSESDALQLVVIGMTDVIAVAMPDAVLVAHKDRAQDVKKAVAELKKQSAPQAETFPRDHRPWGWFESLVIGSRFQVKRIVVHPGAALSLQSHHHRAEHWIVVQGTARVTIGDTVQLLGENQSVYVPLGAKHRLENPGKVALTLIEVQTGGYLGEDDIVRYEDIYARSNDAAE